MYVYMYVCMYVCTYVRTYIRTHARSHARVYVCMYVCMYACMHACMYVCMYVCMYNTYARMYVRMHMCIYVRTFLCAFVHGYMQTCNDINFTIHASTKQIVHSANSSLHIASVYLLSLRFSATVHITVWYVTDPYHCKRRWNDIIHLGWHKPPVVLRTLVKCEFYEARWTKHDLT